MNDYVKGARKSVRKVLTTTNPGMGISNNALNLISVCLSSLNTRLVERCRRENLPKKKTSGVMPVAVAQKAMKKILPAELSYYAEASANMAIMRYNAGMLTYSPKIKAGKKTPSQGRITRKGTFPQFIEGVKFISQMVHEDISMTTEAKNMVALVLQNLAKTVIEKSLRMSSEQGKLSSADIIKAVDSCMAPTMAQHAISEGARNQLLFTNGCSKHKIEDFERLQAENSRMKKRAKRY